MKIKSKRTRFTTSAGLIILFIGIVFFLLRGPYLSNSIKRVLIPVLENATRERIIIDKAVINLFPFYIQAKGLKLFDKDGNRMLWITKTRAYIDLFGLLSREIRIRKLTLKEPDLVAGENDIRRITGNIKQSTSADKKGRYRVVLRGISATGGNIRYTDTAGDIVVEGKDFALTMDTRASVSSLDLIVKKGSVLWKEGSQVEGEIRGRIKVQGQTVQLASLSIITQDSRLETSGFLTIEGKGIHDGKLSGNAMLKASTLNRLFGLRIRKDGALSFNGDVHFLAQDGNKKPLIELDLTTDTWFYLESLMEIVKVKERIEGKLAVRGTIKGTYPDITGKGTVMLENAVFDTLPLDTLKGPLVYEKNKFSLTEFTAHTYQGIMKGNASITIPHGDYEVTADISDVSSPEFFYFIKWEPPFRPGTISGKFHLAHEHGHDISVSADVHYLNTSGNGEKDIFGRLTRVSTQLKMENHVLTLSDALLSTAMSDLSLDGVINLRKKSLALDMRLTSGDVSDFTSPHYTKFNAPFRFTGSANGPLDDPAITGGFEFDGGTVNGIRFTKASADVKYKISSLDVTDLKIDQGKAHYDVNGSIRFRKSHELFSFRDPHYKAHGIFNSAPVHEFISALFSDLPVTGSADGSITFEGDEEKFGSDISMTINDGTVYGQETDSITVKGSLNEEGARFDDVKISRGASALSAKGMIMFDKIFEFEAVSDKISTGDINMLSDYPFVASFGLQAEGKGSLKKPAVRFTMPITDSSLHGYSTGKGTVKGTVSEKGIQAEGTFAEGQAAASLSVSLPGLTPWTADVTFNEGKYDFLLSKLFDEIPEDLSISGKGTLHVNSREGSRLMHLQLQSLSVGMYDYILKNQGDVILDLNNDELTVSSFYFLGNKAGLSASGSMHLNRDFNLSFKGELNLAPLRALTEKLIAIDGRSKLDVNIKGPWKTPELLGEISVENVSAVLDSFPQKIGPVNGKFSLNRDRITFESVSADFAGGTVMLSGMAQVGKFTVDRMFVASDISGIRVRPAEGLKASLDGKLFYDMTSQGSSITGGITLKKSRYDENIDWKSSLLGLKKVNEERIQYPEFLRKARLNIAVNGIEGIVIDNNIARAPIQIHVNLTGTVEHMGLLGRVEAREGYIYFRGNEFRILEGSSVDFVDPARVTPLFHLAAETYRENYLIRLSLDGAADQFNLTMFSDPPLSESDILTLLTFGQINRQKKGIETGIAAGEATSILTGVLQDNVQQEVRSVTGLERFEIEPHTTTTGAFTSRVTVGKRLMEDQVLVTYSTTIGSTEEQIIKIEYKITKDLSLAGSRDELGSTGADVKYRFEFK